MLALGGTISQVFRHIQLRVLVLEGLVDRVKWTFPNTDSDSSETKWSSEYDVLQLHIPLGYSISNMGFIEKFARGRVLLSFPIE